MNYSVKNPNYTAVVVSLEKIVPLENCDNVVSCIIFGNSVIVSKDVKVGAKGLFFPLETQLSHEFVSNNNLYRKAEYGNVDSTKAGYFDQSRRIKCAKFRGNKSEGFFIPLTSLNYLKINLDDLQIGDVFDTIGKDEICRKYYIKAVNEPGAKRLRAKTKNIKDVIVDNQFALHYDSEQLRRNLHRIKKDTTIAVSSKWHGTSAVFSNLLVKRELNIVEKILSFLGVKIQTEEYGTMYSSRTVIKNVNGIDKSGNKHFYTDDVWGRTAKDVIPSIPKSYSIYGEIVGYTESGEPIQAGVGGKAYHYGCFPGQQKFVVYRVTSRNVDGQQIELSWPQMKDFCTKYGLEMVKEFFYGKAYDLNRAEWDCMDLSDDRDWQDALLSYLEKTWVHDQMCEYNNFEVPAEGIVVRVDSFTESEAFKLKNFLFLSGETKLLDAGVVDMESSESEDSE